MKEVKELIMDEVKYELSGLREVEWGNEEYAETIKGINTLTDKLIEIEKVENDKQIKTAQMEADNKDRKVRNGITVAGIIIPTAVTIWGTLKSFKFEETGTVTTLIGRGFINKLLPKK